MVSNIMIQFPRKTTNVIINHVQRRFMPVNVPPTATGKRRFRLCVETDPHKLVNYCCGLNYHIDEPPIQLKPDNEYPDWLWKLRLGPKPTSADLEPGTKEYYYTLREEMKDRNYLLRLRAGKTKKIVDKVALEQREYIHRLRFAALAHMEEDDAGYDSKSMEDHWWFKEQTVKARDYYLPKDENKVLYKDKIDGNIKLKNFYRDPENSFIEKPRTVQRRPSIRLVAYQDSKRRYRYAGT